MNKVVTISRQYSSGGREIGRKLSEIWGVPFYDNELITKAAKESGYAVEAFEAAESRATNSLLYSIARGMVISGNIHTTFSNLSLDDRLYMAQAQVINKVASEGPCVIVGRCADYILKDRENLVNIFVMADMDFRIERAQRIDGMPSEKIEENIRKMDKRRYNYYNFHTGEKWGKAENYSLCINSSRVGIENAVRCIREYVEAINSLSLDELEGVTGGASGDGGEPAGVQCPVCGCRFGLPEGKVVWKCPDCGSTVTK